MVLSWGRGEDGQLGHGDAEERRRPSAVFALKKAKCSAVYSGAEYSVALSTADNQVYSWGW
jgi:alpha-tubulin suppressor-like RCC1 family protein